MLHVCCRGWGGWGWQASATWEVIRKDNRLQGPWGYESKTVMRGRRWEEEAAFLQAGPFGPLELPGHSIHKGAQDECRGRHGRVLGMAGRQRASGFGKGVGKVLRDKDESQKSAQGNPGAAGALTEQLEP